MSQWAKNASTGVKWVSLLVYYDYQMSKAQQSFGLKTMVTISLPTILHALLLMTSKSHKLSLEKEPVAHDINCGHQTFVMPYSTNNHSRMIST